MTREAARPAKHPQSRNVRQRRTCTDPARSTRTYRMPGPSSTGPNVGVGGMDASLVHAKWHHARFRGHRAGYARKTHGAPAAAIALSSEVYKRGPVAERMCSPSERAMATGCVVWLSCTVSRSSVLALMGEGRPCGSLRPEGLAADEPRRWLRIVGSGQQRRAARLRGPCAVCLE
ncbi:uncharacterized protein B0H18DRAFT_1209125 [Fomitopsis serialis]|uniref:uncharacterized protein n=1 Tax=Fomitopsis serialis TaxID=139415 RepID=UPI0020080079|nr:uncharacterized protein B0H18DRAFT_1209125 [Neoantrodia serialis]KAH9930928.1 hypothetical protein B0H18DRAFT_1209125 [Neoantrodia serialis]